jgi:hypothetical protein
MSTTPRDTRLAERLHDVTSSIDGPLDTDALVRRGRANVRRRRALGTAAALCVLGTAYAAGAVTGAIGPRNTGPVTMVADTPTPTATAASAGQPRSSCEVLDPGTGELLPHRVGSAQTTTDPAPSTHSFDHYLPTLRTYRDLLVTHLDPQQQHLLDVDNVQPGSDGACTTTSLGTKLGWQSAGAGGLGMVQVEVTASWDDGGVHLAHDGWRRTDPLPAGATDAYVVDYPLGTAVAVTRADGITVAIDASSLFANNSTTPVAPMPITTEQLLPAAADRGFKLP